MKPKSVGSTSSVPVCLFCIPFAGGSSYSFVGFQKHIHRRIDLRPIELPGRGARFGEPLLDDLRAIGDDVVAQIRGQLDRPYAFFGHSMGAYLCNLVIRQLKSEGLPLPVHLFVSSCRSPSKYDGRRIHALPKNEFSEALFELGGCPPGLLEDDELVEIFEHVLRSDIKATELFDSVADGEPHGVPVTVMVGEQEEEADLSGEAWGKEAGIAVVVEKFAGDHFFIYQHESAICRLFANSLFGEAKLSQGG